MRSLRLRKVKWLAQILVAIKWLNVVWLHWSHFHILAFPATLAQWLNAGIFSVQMRLRFLCDHRQVACSMNVSDIYVHRDENRMGTYFKSYVILIIYLKIHLFILTFIHMSNYLLNDQYLLVTCCVPALVLHALYIQSVLTILPGCNYG